MQLPLSLHTIMVMDGLRLMTLPKLTISKLELHKLATRVLLMILRLPLQRWVLIFAPKNIIDTNNQISIQQQAAVTYAQPTRTTIQPSKVTTYATPQTYSAPATGYSQTVTTVKTTPRKFELLYFIKFAIFNYQF